MTERDKLRQPNILVIPDGHRRWAKRNGATVLEAYEAGAKRMAAACRYLGDLGIRQVWISVARPFALERDPREVQAFIDKALELPMHAEQEGQPLHLHWAGRLEGTLPEGYKELLKASEQTENPNSMTAHMMYVWSAESEVEDLCAYVRANPDAPIDQASLVAQSAIKEPIDFIVRTGLHDQRGGRVSGIAPWHSFDAELYFTDTQFPDFTPEHMQEALQDYAGRQHKDQLYV